MPKRVIARTKLTKNGRIKGRPVNGQGPVKIEPKLRSYVVGWKRPRMIVDPITGEEIRPDGPMQPICRVREVRRGRPPVEDQKALLRIVDAVVAFGRKGNAEAEATMSGLKPETVKRERRRARNFAKSK